MTGPPSTSLSPRGSPGRHLAISLTAAFLVVAGALAFGLVTPLQAAAATPTAVATVQATPTALPPTAAATPTAGATQAPTVAATSIPATATLAATSVPATSVPATATLAATTVPKTATAAATSVSATATAVATGVPPAATLAATAPAVQATAGAVTTTAIPTAVPATATVATLIPTATPKPAATTAVPTPARVSVVSNDDIAAAVLVGAFPYTTTLDTLPALLDVVNDPDMGAGYGQNLATVWYRFVAPSAGSVEVDTAGSNYDTILAAYTGAPGALNRVASNDDAGSLQSDLLFDVQAGTTYYLEVAGLDGGGQLSLRVRFTAAGPASVPANDDFGAADLISAFPFEATLDTTLATAAGDDPSMMAGTGINSNTVWYRFTPSAAGSVRARTHSSGYDTVLAAYTGARGALVLIASNDDSGSLQSELAFTVQAGVTYYLEVADYGASGGGQLRLRVESSTTPLPGAATNDNFDLATTITLFPFSVIQDSSAATLSPDDPDMWAGLGQNQATLWYRFVAPGVGSVRASTSGSSYDTVLAVYTGSRGSLTPVANNDDTTSLQSEVVFDVQAGTGYYLEAAGVEVGGQLNLAVQFTPSAVAPPANDEFAQATAIGSLPFADALDTSLATTAAYDPPMEAGSGTNSKSVWYRLTAPGAGAVSANTFGSGYDTVLAAFTGTQNALSLVVSNDDDQNTRQSEISFNVQSGATYYLEAARYGNSGNSRLNVAVHFNAAPPTPTPVVPPATSTPLPTATTVPQPTAAPEPSGGDDGSSGGSGGSSSQPVPPATQAPSGSGSQPAGTAVTDDSSGRGQFVATPVPAAPPILGAPVGVTRITSSDIPAGVPRPAEGGVVARIEAASGAGVVTTDDGKLTISVGNSQAEPLVAYAQPATPSEPNVLAAVDLQLFSCPSGQQCQPAIGNPVVLEFKQLTRDQLETIRSGQQLPRVRITHRDGTVEQVEANWTDSPPPGHVWVSTTSRSLYELIVVPRAQARTVPADSRYFAQTGYRVNVDGFWDYFQKRGGLRTFGYPISREFTLEGFKVQFFQRAILQQLPNGSVARMNLLDEGLMPYTQINFSRFPAPERALMDEAPSPADPLYAEKARAFLSTYVQNRWEGMDVKFFDTFMGTVRYEDAFPNGEGDASLLPLLNLEIWGLPTSSPTRDPANGNFVYQRFQRGIMHFDASTGATQGLLLADYFKSIVTGKNLPADLAEQARGSRFFAQLDTTRPGHLARPSELGGTDLRDAFEPEVPQSVVASAQGAGDALVVTWILGAMILAARLRASRRTGSGDSQVKEGLE